LVRRLYDGRLTANAAGPTAAMAAVLAPGFVHHFDTDNVLDRAQYLEAVGVFYRAFPDLVYSMEDLIAEGDRVVVRYVARGTHRGDFFGLPPTGRAVTYRGTYTYRVADGLIQEDWEHWDGKGFDLQLGLLSRPARADAPSVGTGE
jgi:steroid delta-isomerase-like uncharacterized protein